MSKFSIQTRKTGALDATMAASATSCTLAAATFGTPTGKQIVTIDGDDAAKAADFLCTIAGTAISSMTLLNGPDVEHATGAPVWMGAVDEHTDFIFNYIDDGWVDASKDETWVYASADDPTFTFTIAGVDLTAKYTPGTRIKLTQTSVKYFIVTKVAFSTDTTVTVYGGTDYDLANAAITAPYYSRVKAPAGFPLDPAKWSVTLTDTTTRNQATPTQNTWYNLGSLSIDIPIGVWETNYQLMLYAVKTSTTSINAFATLSTANNSESDANWTTSVKMDGASGNLEVWNSVSRENTITLTSKTTHYLNARSTVASMAAIQFIATSLGSTQVRAVCAYL